MRRVIEIVRKEFLQLRRDRRMLPILFIAPAVQSAVLGYAATTDLKDVPVALCDQDRSADSRALVDAITAGGHFRVIARSDDPDGLDPWLDGSRAEVAVAIPADFARRLAAGQPAPVQVLVDGSKVNAARALNELAAAIGRHGRGLAAQRLSARGLVVRRPEVVSETRVWYNPDLSSRHFMVPGVLATVLMVVTMIVTSMAIAKEREVGTLEQLVVTPIRAGELIAGKLIPYFLIGIAESLLVIAVAVGWFEVPLRGSFPLLLALALLFMVNAQGIGLFVSTVSRTQQQAMMTAVFFIMLPMILLSGFVFPIENMPPWVQWLTYAMPMRYFLVIVRGIFLKGVGWTVLWPQVAALGALAVAALSLAALRFHKRLG